MREIMQEKSKNLPRSNGQFFCLQHEFEQIKSSQHSNNYHKLEHVQNYFLTYHELSDNFSWPWFRKSDLKASIFFIFFGYNYCMNAVFWTCMRHAVGPIPCGFGRWSNITLTNSKVIASFPVLPCLLRSTKMQQLQHYSL